MKLLSYLHPIVHAIASLGATLGGLYAIAWHQDWTLGLLLLIYSELSDIAFAVHHVEEGL